MKKSIKYLSIITGTALFCLTSCMDFSMDGDGGNPQDVTFSVGSSLNDALGQNTRVYQFELLGNYIDLLDPSGNPLRDEFGRPKKDTLFTPGGFFKKPDLTHLDNSRITFKLKEGWWNFRLVSAMNPGDIAGVIDPIFNKKPVECKMWEHTASGEYLPDMPELYTAHIEKVHFTGKWYDDGSHKQNVWRPDYDYKFPAEYTRNVSKIRVHFEMSEDLDANGAHFIELSNVPNALNWEGGFFPNKDNPQVAEAPMRKGITLIDIPGMDNKQKYDGNPAEFIIPAHRGKDFAAGKDAIDTTTNLLRYAVFLTSKDGSQIIKRNLVLPYAPRLNTIYDLTISYNKRKLTVTSKLQPWVDENLQASITNQIIRTDKPDLQLSSVDTITIKSQNPYTVTKAADAPWIKQLRDLGNNRWEITLETEDYTVPRSSYLIIKTKEGTKNGNLEKRIPVTQRPDPGTIRVRFVDSNTYIGGNEKESWISGSPANKSRQVEVTSIGGDWKILPNMRVLNDVTGASGTRTVSITRKVGAPGQSSEMDIPPSEVPNVSGRGAVVFKNNRTLATDTLYLDNYFIGLRTEIIEIGLPKTHPSYLTNTTTGIIVDGGAKDVIIKWSEGKNGEANGWPEFISNDPNFTFYNKNTGVFTFRSLSNATGSDKYGDIVLAHASDPDYKVSLPIDQANLDVIPEFDFFVIKYIWSGQQDIDISSGFWGNPVTQVYRGITYNISGTSQINGIFVGWSCNGGNLTKFAGKDLLKWGGDATGGQGETVFFNARELNTYPYPGQKIPVIQADGFAKLELVKPNAANMLPRVCKLHCNAGWYRGAGSATVQITCYLSGSMVQSGTNFNNTGGSNVFTQERTFVIPTGSAYKPKDGYRHICIIEYDRKRHTANIVWQETDVPVGTNSGKGPANG